MPQPNFRMTATIIWAALCAGVLLFFAVSLFVRLPGDPRLVGVMLPVSAALTLVTTAVSWLWAVRMRPALPPGTTPHTPEQLALTRLIVATALCEGAALFAIVGFLVTGADARMVGPLAVSLASILAHYPGDRHWARLTGGPAAGAPRRNPMIRG
jgi:hypothetical protein